MSSKVFTVWPRSHDYLPGIEFYTGHGSSTREAVEDLFTNLPERFCVEDGISVETVSLEHEQCRPFEVVHSDSIRTFVLCWHQKRQRAVITLDGSPFHSVAGIYRLRLVDHRASLDGMAVEFYLLLPGSLPVGFEIVRFCDSEFLVFHSIDYLLQS